MVPPYIGQWLHTQLEQLHYSNVRQCFVDVSRMLDDAAWLQPRAAALPLTGSHLVTLQGSTGAHSIEIWLSTSYPQDASYVYVDGQQRPAAPGLSLAELLRAAMQPPARPEKPSPPPAPAVPTKPPKLPAKSDPAPHGTPPAPPRKGPQGHSSRSPPASLPTRTVPPLPAKQPGGPRGASLLSSNASPASAPEAPLGAHGPPRACSTRPDASMDIPGSPAPGQSIQGPVRTGGEYPLQGSPYVQDPRAQKPYMQNSHAHGPYAQGPYMHGPYTHSRDVATPQPQGSSAPLSTHYDAALSTRQAQHTQHIPPAPNSRAAPPKSNVPQSKPPPINLLDAADTPAPAVSSERAQAIARVESALRYRAAELYHESQAEAQQLAAASHALNQTDIALARERASLLRTKEALVRNIEVLEHTTGSALELAQRAAENPPSKSIPDLVTVTASDRAVVEADSSNRAIDDLLRILPRALDAGSVSLHVYLRLVRQYSREQFSHRHALLQRRPEPPKPPAKH